MESEGENSTATSSSSSSLTTSTTNWIVASGSIENAITFESSSSVDDHDDDPRSSSSLPLILRPPASNSSFCEITISVKQKHELRQVYVRSTARLYEIYYASDLKSSNEYLCTVRCGIATKDEDVLSVPHSDVADVASSMSATQKVDDRNLKTEGSSSSTNEDGWVEIKIPNNFNGQSSKKNHQEFYEATAEMSDTDPCASLTIRLLSLQNKECVCIDEIYVFADPVDPIETKSQASETPQNLAGSSLMAMLVPTILQLSKAHGKQTSDRGREHRINEVDPKSNEATIVSETQQDSKSSSDDQQEAESRHQVIPQQTSNPQTKPDLSWDRMEKVLGQLVSRVSRVEEFMLRFEERMLKPINSIDERLQQVEQQIEGLTAKLQISGVPPGVRISAPDFSCCESTENSVYLDGANDLNLGVPEKDGQEFSSSHNTADVVAPVTQPTPGLRVTAPEFSNADEDEESDKPVLVSDSLKEKPKRVYSIDDALASALTGFLSSTLENRKYTEALSVKAPDFSNEDSDNKDRRDLTEPEITSGPVLVSARNSEATFSNISPEMEESMLTCQINTADSEIPDNETLKADVKWRHNVIGEENGSLRKKWERFLMKTEDPEIPGNESLKDDVEWRHNVAREDNDTLGKKMERCLMNAEDPEISDNEVLKADVKWRYNVAGEENLVNTEDPEIPGNEILKAKVEWRHGVIGEEGDSVGNKLESGDLPTTHDLELKDDVANGESSNNENENDNSKIKNVIQVDNFFPGSERTVKIVRKREEDKESEISILQDFVRMSSISSQAVNFETPILDVKFNSEHSEGKSPFEALWGDMPESNIEKSDVAEDVNGIATHEQDNLISLTDNDLTGSVTGANFTLDVNYCSVSTIDTEHLNLPENHMYSCNQETTAIKSYFLDVTPVEGLLYVV
ncbi:hypothetical protein ACFE04_000503 [Oxalis oulophora]